MRSTYAPLVLVICALGNGTEMLAAEDKPFPLQVYVVPAHPVAGKPAKILVKSSNLGGAKGATIQVTYRPNSKVEQTVTLPDKVGEDETVTWIPTDEGVVKVEAIIPRANPEAPPIAKRSLECAVRFDGMPVLGVFVFFLAFVVLFGGLTWSLIRGA